MTELDLLIRMGGRIKALRVQRSMTQYELAIECNFEKATMSRIESGQSNPTVRTLLKICNVLEVGMHELFIH